MIYIYFQQTVKFEMKKAAMLEKINQLMALSQRSSPPGSQFVSPEKSQQALKARLQQEVEIFTRKIALLAQAKDEADQRITRLAQALKKMKGKS